ncbi:MAG TPA: TadE family protein [Novosphingobium sp.]|nr:TadE family protein [Novosphingobium sp.]
MNRLQRLTRDTAGSVAVEFALLGPLMIGMLFGVLQIGIGMKAYNSLRAIASDTARYAAVNYQTANRLTNTQLQSYGRAVAIATPYGLRSDRVTVSVTTPTTQRVTGATEKKITITYKVDTLLKIINVRAVNLTYSRPIFLTT